LPSTSVAAVEDLQERWWSWAASSPEETNPVVDTTGRDCARKQPDDLWFLAGTFGSSARRTCTVPAGQRLAVPVVNQFGPAADCPGFLAGATGAVTVDGRPQPVLRLDAESVRIVGVAGNPVTGDGGGIETTACGLWVVVPPLTRGGHTVVISGRAAGDFAVDVNYRLTVR
jgi:hypothetical protein